MINQCINPKLRLLAIGLACILFGSLIMSFLGAFEALGAENEIETPFDNSAKSKTALTSHAPIYINSNSQFTAANGVVSGSGTASNPYIIEGWDINAKTKNGIDIRNTTAYFTIRNCCIHDGKSNYKYGIYFYNVKNGRIENVTSYNNYHGIYLHKSSCNQIVNSASYNNYDYGIWLHGSRECIDSYETTVVNTPVYRNYVGIYIYYSHRNKITGCQIYNNSDTGIWLSQTYKNGSNVITENLIQNNGYGAKLTSCADYNFIYHNDFIDNARQAYDEESYGGSWDNGYPSGGNYWSDYTGTDSYSGPNQDQPGSDGIGDTPYEIPTYYFDTYAEDRYPLMRSFNIPKNQPPNASFIYSPDTPTTDTVIQFTDTSTDSDGYIVSWYWDFGDRNSSTLQNPTHRYTVYGNYTVTLTVEDNGSAKSSFSRTIFVLPTNWPPVASFDYSPRYPTTNDIIQFNDTSTDSDGYIVAWYWDFGDGNNSTAQNPKHRYTKDGIYKVILRVEDNGSAAGWCSSFIRVAPNQPPTIDITYPVDKQVVKEVVVIKGTASDADSIVTNVYVRIDNASWDDIAVSPAQSLSWEKAWNTTKVLNGLHTIYARAYDGVDYSEIKSAKVYVYNPAPAPIVTITYPEEGQKVNSTVTITGT
ncbi:MAG: PKD domain-containing protein, partial [Candidatus Thermoplasmatota archaeon]